MSQRHFHVESILAMLDGKYTKDDIKQALNDLDAMKDNIKKSTYESVKALLEAKL